MNIARGIARWGLALLIGTCVSTWILAATFNATLANREVLKTWLASSNIYKNGLGSMLQVSADGQSNSTLMDLITASTLQQALVSTFDGAYMQASSNKVIDASYDWLEGKAPAITFTIPVQDKAGDFNANLAAAIKPKLQMLPPCTSKLGNLNTSQITCVPAGINIDDYAKQLAQPSSDNGFLKTPITQETLRGSFPQIDWLPAMLQLVHTLLWTLPIVVTIAGALYVLVSQSKLQGLSRVGRQLAINAGVSLVAGLFIWYASSSIDLSNSLQSGDAQQTAIVTSLINPLARTVVPDLGRTLSLFSGVVAALGGMLWLGGYLLHRHLHKDVEPPFIPPSAHTEAHLPPPLSKP